MIRTRTIRRLLTLPVTVLAVLVVLWEETFWTWMTAFGGWLVERVPLFMALERLVSHLSPRWVGLVFAIPLAGLVPVKLGAVWLIINGHYLLGTCLIVSVKVGGTAFSAELFQLAKPKLMQLKTFAWVYTRVRRWIDFAHAYVHALPAWRAAKAFLRISRGWLSSHSGGLVSRRFCAARRRARRAPPALEHSRHHPSALRHY